MVSPICKECTFCLSSIQTKPDFASSNLQNNFLKTVPEGLFEGLSSLQEMYCSVSLSSVLVLIGSLSSLSANYLESVPKGLFQGLSQLQEM